MLLKRFNDINDEAVFINPAHVVCVTKNTVEEKQDICKIFLSTGENDYINVKGSLTQVVNHLNP